MNSIDKYIFINAKFSIQNNLLGIDNAHRIINTNKRSRGIIYVYVTIFHIIEMIQANTTPAICIGLSDSKNFGNIPTKHNPTTDRNGRN